MTRLNPSFPLGVGESPASFVSALGRLHGSPNAREFSLDMGFTFQAVVDGDPETLHYVADLACVDADTLTSNATRRIDGGYDLAGERLLRSTMRRTKVRACPRCLVSDTVVLSRPRHAAMYGRTRWLLDPIRSCPEHGTALVEVASADIPGSMHDFSLLVDPEYDRVRRLAEDAQLRPTSDLERYLLGRLGEERVASPWLDSLPWHAVARTCEVVGLVADFGRTAKINGMTEADWHRAGHTGFRVAQAGERSIRAFLSELQRTYPASSLGKEGPQAVFGSLHRWLASTGKHPDFDPVREIMFRHVHETMPVGPDAELFGRRFPNRLVHSIRTASLESGAHPKRLRKVLAAAGVLVPEHAGRLDHHATFDAVTGAAILSAVTETLSLVETRSYLNSGRVQTTLLQKAGYISPEATTNDGVRPDHFRFSRKELDTFLYRLGKDAVRVDSVLPPIFGIPRAAKFARRGAMDVVKLILGRDLDWVGSLAGERGYRSIVVDGEELKERLKEPPVPGRPKSHVVDVLRTTDKVVTALIGQGIIPVTKVRNPLTGTRMDMVLDKDLERFQTDHVFLFGIVAETGRHHLQVKTELQALGVYPAFDPKIVKATIYRRSDLT